MTEKRRHSLAGVLSPEPLVKEKKKWSFDSFSPLYIGATLHSKWKRKSTERIHAALKKHADDHDIEMKSSVSRSRWGRRASVAVVSSETNSQLLLPDKLSSQHHGSVLSLWKRKTVTQVLTDTSSPEEDIRPSSPEEGIRASAAIYKRRASIAVTQLHTEHTVNIKPQKVKTKKGSKEYFVAVVHLSDERTKMVGRNIS